MMPVVRFREVRKAFGPLVVLDSVSLDIARGERVAVIGRSGSGKTTLLRALMTLEPIDGGEIEVEGEAMWHVKRNGRAAPADESHLRHIRSKIGMVFQQFNLFPHMTALGNVCAPLMTVLHLSRDEATNRATELLVRVGLQDKLHSYPAKLSGGQQQRVAIARALAMRPRVMLFDEITSALDPEIVGEVLNVLRMLAHEHDLTMIMVTHQFDFAKDIADRVLFFDQGRIIEQGKPAEIFNSPQNERTRAFVNAVLSA